MTTTATYAGLLAFLFIALSVRVIEARRTARVAIGDGGNMMLLRRQRAHGNFAEYVPLALLLMALGELQGLPHWILHAMGIVLLAGRLAHAYGVSQEPEPVRIRVFGMALTFTVLTAGAISNLVMPFTA